MKNSIKNWPKISAFISDLDGVTYRGKKPIESAVNAFRLWNDIGIPYAFVTNNSTKSAEEFSSKLNAMNIPADPKKIITYWRDNILALYEKEILEGDITFFVNKDYRNDIGTEAQTLKVLEDIKIDNPKALDYFSNFICK